MQHCYVSLLMGLRSRSFQISALFGAFALIMAYIVSSFSGRQPAIVTLDIGISITRLLALILVVFWTQELISKEIERKTVVFALSFPQDRSAYLIGRFAGIGLLAGCLIAIMAALIFVEQRLLSLAFPALSHLMDPIDLLPMFALIWLDVLTILAFSICLAAVSTSSFTPLIGGISFALAARSLGPALDYARSLTGATDTMERSFLPVLDIVRYILPDLSRLDIRPIALYRVPATFELVGLPAIQALAYLIGFMALAVLLFRRREFM